MTVRAIDMITMLPRTAEAGRGQQQSLQHSTAFQQAQAAQQLARAKQAQEQVTARSPAEEAHVRQDGAGGGQGGPGERRNGRRRKGEEQSEPVTPPGVGQRLDIKV